MIGGTQPVSSTVPPFANTPMENKNCSVPHILNSTKANGIAYNFLSIRFNNLLYSTKNSFSDSASFFYKKGNTVKPPNKGRFLRSQMFTLQ